MAELRDPERTTPRKESPNSSRYGTRGVAQRRQSHLHQTDESRNAIYMKKPNEYGDRRCLSTFDDEYENLMSL